MQRTINAWFLLLSLVSVFISGCTNYQVHMFSSSTIGVAAAADYVPQPVAVATFVDKIGGKRTFGCRSVERSIILPNKQAVSTYIQQAFVATLIEANRYDRHSDYTLRGEITLVDFNTTSGYWLIRGRFNMANGAPVMVSGKYPFASSWGSDRACDHAAAAFDQAVQSFVGDVLTRLSNA